MVCRLAISLDRLRQERRGLVWEFSGDGLLVSSDFGSDGAECTRATRR